MFNCFNHGYISTLYNQPAQPMACKCFIRDKLGRWALLSGTNLTFWRKEGCPGSTSLRPYPFTHRVTVEMTIWPDLGAPRQKKGCRGPGKAG